MRVLPSVLVLLQARVVDERVLMPVPECSNALANFHTHAHKHAREHARER